jgi:hypothetical protein
MDSFNDIFKLNLLKNECTQNVCSICLGVIGEYNKAVTKCGHNFCLTCLLESLKENNTCPLCRSSLETKRPIPYQKLSIDRTNKYIEEVLENYDVSLVLFLIKNSQRNSYMNLLVHLRTMMTDLIRKLIIFQYRTNDSDEDNEEEEENEDEDNEDDEDEEATDL